jgi:VanZ family protein
MQVRSPDARWTAAVVATVVLLAGSLVPSPLKRRPGWKWVGPDKWLHFVGHAVYAVTLANALGAGRRSDGHAAVLAVGLSTLHSLLAGRLQRWVPGRAFEPVDVAAGLLGAVLGVYAWWSRSDRHHGSSSRPSR